ncbi:MAG: MFS transporter [Candidatus Nanohaloarchaea archaeon]
MKLLERDLKGLEANIWKIYLFRLFFGFFLSIPVIVLFWKANGLSMFQIMVLQSLFSIAVISLEVPTGYFADRYGRKRTLLIASVFATAGIATYSVGHSFLEFLLGEVLWAVGVTLISGADSAMIYDTLAELGEEARYQEVWGRASSYAMFSAAAAALLGGLIADFNLRWTLYVQVPFMAAMIPVAYSLREPEHHEEVGEEGQETLKAIIRKVMKKADLRWLMIYAAFIYAGLQTAFWMYQPYFELSGLPVAAFGAAYAAFNIVSAVSSKYAHVVESWLGKTLSLVLLLVLLVASLMLMGRFVFFFSFAFIFLHQFVRGFQKPVISDYVNRLVSSGERSTVLSTRSLLGRLFQAGSLPVFGLFIDFYSVPQALLLLAVTTLAGGAVFLFLLYTEDVIKFGPEF